MDVEQNKSASVWCYHVIMYQYVWGVTMKALLLGLYKSGMHFSANTCKTMDYTTSGFSDVYSITAVSSSQRYKWGKWGCHPSLIQDKVLHTDNNTPIYQRSSARTQCYFQSITSAILGLISWNETSCSNKGDTQAALTRVAFVTVTKMKEN